MKYCIIETQGGLNFLQLVTTLAVALIWGLDCTAAVYRSRVSAR